jgi:tetratricopeptide (TPR) repeat protein
MRLQIVARWGTVVITAAGLLAISACGGGGPEPAAPSANPARSQPATATTAPGEPLKNEIPSGDLEKVMAAHYRGLGHMEQYEYKQAVEDFREVRKCAPGWIPGLTNLAIALLNDSGVKAEEAKKAGAEPAPDNYDEALELLAGVLERDPDNPYAHYSRGIILESKGNLAEAHRHFKRVTEIDPNDGSAWFRAGSTLSVSLSSNAAERREQAKQSMVLYEKALACDPYLTPAFYKLAFAYVYAGEPQKQKELLARWNEMNPDRPGPVPGPGSTAADPAYGDTGKYATIVDPFPRPEPSPQRPDAPPKFEAPRPLNVTLPPGDRWVKPADFTGPLAVIGRARARFGAAIVAFDANSDGRLDVFLPAAVVGAKGIRDVLLLNKGEGRFEDASAAFGLSLDHASLGAAAADFDADRHVDLFLTGIGDNRLLRNRDGKRFEDLTATTLKPIGPPALSLMARWLDLDQDGDLDLYTINYCAAEHAGKAFTDGPEVPPGLPNSVYRNDGQPTPDPTSPPPAWAPLAVAAQGVHATAGLSLALAPWTGAEALAGSANLHTGIAALDLDNDRDLDLVLASDSAPPEALVNDRLGQFRSVKLETLALPGGASGLLVSDFDADGRADLAAPYRSGPLLAFRNTLNRTTVQATRYTFEPWPGTVSNLRASQAVDLDLDGRADLLALPAASTKSGEATVPAWARNDGTRLVTKPLSLGVNSPGLEGLLAVDLVGDPLPDILMLRGGEPPAMARNLGNGNHWLGLQLGGHWNVRKKLMRTNSHAIGTRVTLQGVGTLVTYNHTTPESGLGQSITPFVLGLGNKEAVDLVHLNWPDGVLQCELNVTGNEVIKLAENNRKISSCPVLFTWNGSRFVCIGDFLGGGGLGYLIAPGLYSQPDRDEAVAITSEQLQPTDGVFRLSVTEPMDEIAYLDHLRLDVVDRPPGVSSTPDERFAPQGPRPGGEVIAWRTAVEPEHATDLEGHDVTETLRHWDRRTVDQFRKRTAWIGYAEEHGIILDFDGQLSRYSTSDSLVLCLAGWVEYPYSQTNYAAATSGVVLQPPVIERLADDGHWQLIEPHAGYPAGMPRLMTLDLTGKLAGPRCVLRIRTNMECYYDQAFIAVRDRSSEASLHVTKLSVARAELAYRGYTREVSPDGRQPLLYDYDYVDPAPLARFIGKLTRYGDVAPLLKTDDDQLCLVGPGDEVRLEFDASGLPSLPAGWTRSYILRGYGYCKDADPFTALSDTVGPLPWRLMPPFPFRGEVTRPSDPAYEAYLRAYQTRPAGGRTRR